MPLLLLLALLLTACGGGSEEGNSQEVLTQAAQIAIEGLTQTAAAAPPTATNTPEPTPTNTPEPTATFTSTPESDDQAQQATATQPQQANSDKPCWRGNLEYETVPDGSIYYQNKVFTKTWRIKNTGSCTWPADTVAIFIEGDLMGASSVIKATDVEILPNGYIEVNVDFQSPQELGTYKSYWMLRGGGAIFGVGTTGLEWFWVQIKTEKDPN